MNDEMVYSLKNLFGVCCKTGVYEDYSIIRRCLFEAQAPSQKVLAGETTIRELGQGSGDTVYMGRKMVLSKGRSSTGFLIFKKSGILFCATVCLHV